jgi:predicted PhzF superfamily epimerase YddE/YHI9
MRIEHTVVFADGEGGGNPCPVVFGAGDWETGRMQELAARLGHETAFVLRDGDRVRLRCFVPHHEMEMCVHATVAAVVLLARAGEKLTEVETPLGTRRVWPDVDASSAVVEQFPPVFGEPVDPAPVLETLGARPDQLGDGPVRSVSHAISRSTPATTRTRPPGSPPAASARTSRPRTAGAASRSPRAAPWAARR